MADADQLRDEPEAPIAARGLVKRYGEIAAVDGIDLTVRRGEIYGFLGPNGAGKTTTLRMLLSLVRPDAGSIRLFGRDLAADPVAGLEGVAGSIEEPRLYPYLSGRENLELLAAFDRSGQDEGRVDEVLELVELSDRAGDRVSEYSQGMRQRLGLASCLVRRPSLLLLDEPANGVDPAGIRFLRDLLRRLAADGITIFLSSHLLSEVQQVCGRVAVISRGRIVYEGALDELRGVSASRYRLEPTDLDRAKTALRGVSGIRDVREEGGTLIVGVDGDPGLVALTETLAGAGVGIRALTTDGESLERLFFELTEDRAEAVGAQ